MATSQQSLGAILEQPAMPVDDFMRFYVCQHESKRSLPVTGSHLRQAQEVGYDTLTSPITTPHFHSRVLALLSSHLSEISQSDLEDDAQKTCPPAPIIPPLTPFDTPLTPDDTVSQFIACASTWIDLCSPDPLVANISRQVLTIEVAYASFCGVSNIIVPGPRHQETNQADGDGLMQYARAIQEALSTSAYVQITIHIPMYDNGSAQGQEVVGDLAPFARNIGPSKRSPEEEDEPDIYGTWDAWNSIRSVCKYNSRLTVESPLLP